MYPQLALTQTAETLSQLYPMTIAARSAAAVSPLTNEHEQEALDFLSARPVHTVLMVGYIRDNGLISPLNRGTFYAFRDSQGELEGVALIGHINLIETRTARALKAFAQTAQKCTNTHLIMAEQERVEEFWSYYADKGQQMRLVGRELLFELRAPFMTHPVVPDLRLATPEELDLVMPVQAQMAFEESGVNPMEKDPEGFSKRCLRRIEQGRTWVLIENGKLIFKADIMSDTPEVIYLEGVYVSPESRGKGIGIRCMSQLAGTLLKRVNSICLLVNEQNKKAHKFYQRAGYKVESYYDTIFLQQRSN